MSTEQLGTSKNMIIEELNSPPQAGKFEDLDANYEKLPPCFRGSDNKGGVFS